VSGEPQDVETRRKRGAPKGNRNRFKNGLYTNEAKALRKEIASWKRETRALLLKVRQSPPPCGEADNSQSEFRAGVMVARKSPTRNLRRANFDLPTSGR
jgi:hypothetical protein